MTLEDVASAKKFVLGAVLVYVLWLVAQSAFSFAGQLKQQRHAHIIEMSETFPSSTPLPPPLSQATR